MLNLKKMTVSELKELEMSVSSALESRKKKLEVVSEIMEKVKEMGLEVSDLLNHLSMKKRRGRKAKSMS